MGDIDTETSQAYESQASVATTSSTDTSILFQPYRLGSITLGHRIVLAPLARRRADDKYVHTELAVEYYAQRASTPGTLLITESTYIAQCSVGKFYNPGVWSDEQIKGWAKVVQAVHARHSFIFLQLRAAGRDAEPEVLKYEDPSLPVVSSSNIPVSHQSSVIPKPLTIPEIQEYVEFFASSAVNAVYKAGCDGVEVHAANGYIIDQFTQDICNVREDEYGGSIENRCRFSLEVVDAVVKAVGAERTGIRLSPWSRFLGMPDSTKSASLDMRMEDPIPTFTYLVTQLRIHHPNLAYIHVIEPRIYGSDDDTNYKPSDSNDFIREIWAPRPLISAGKYHNVEKIVEAAKRGELIAIGRYFISNPDLPERIRRGASWTPYDRSTFYTQGPKGYIDYPFLPAQDK